MFREKHNYVRAVNEPIFQIYIYTIMASALFTEHLENLIKKLTDFAEGKSAFQEAELKETAKESALVLSQIAALNQLSGSKSASQTILVSKGKEMRELYVKIIDQVTEPMFSFLKITMVRYEADEVKALVDLAGDAGKIRICPGLVNIGTDKYKMSFVLVAEDANEQFRLGAPLPGETEGTVLDDGKPCPPDCPPADFIALPS